MSDALSDDARHEVVYESYDERYFIVYALLSAYVLDVDDGRCHCRLRRAAMVTLSESVG